MISIRSLASSVLGSIDELGSKRYFVSLACFVISVFFLIRGILHLAMDLDFRTAVLAGVTVLFTLGLFLVLRLTKYLYGPMLVLSLFGFALLDLGWYTKYMSDGPVLYLLLIFGALFMWMWEGRMLRIMMAVYFLNFGLLFIIEYYGIGKATVYPTDRVRLLDIYLSLPLYGILLVSILLGLRRLYTDKEAKAIRSDKLKSAFLANMSHEIRTPLNAIVGFSELLVEQKNPELSARYSELVSNSSDALLRLINDIIDLSKIEASDLNLESKNVDPGRLFEELHEVYQAELLKKGKIDVELTYNLPADFPSFRGDYVRLKQVLSNLLSNAIKFTVEGVISYSCKKKGRELEFSVSDSGTGIPLQDQEKIFGQFVSFNYGGLNTEGTGIGLSIAERIVKLFEGRIWLDSKPGEGSVFYFTIPYKAPLKDKDKDNKTQSPKPMQKSVKETTRTILVVEDDHKSQELMKAMLQQLDIQVECVEDGNQAIKFVIDNPDTSLILMDLKLPVMNGYDATRTIKKINPGIPIVAQTAYAMAGDREKALEAGCDDYFSKPISQSTLMVKVKEILAGPQDLK